MKRRTRGPSPGDDETCPDTQGKCRNRYITCVWEVAVIQLLFVNAGKVGCGGWVNRAVKRVQGSRARE